MFHKSLAEKENKQKTLDTLLSFALLLYYKENNLNHRPLTHFSTISDRGITMDKSSYILSKSVIYAKLEKNDKRNEVGLSKTLYFDWIGFKINRRAIKITFS